MASALFSQNGISSSYFDTSLKSLVESSSLNVVPSKFNFTNDPTAFTPDSLPVIDFSALIAGDRDQRSKALHDLDAACRDWGFFILVNHGIPKTMMNAVFTAVKEFFDLPESEKKKYEAKSVWDPIKCGSFKMKNASDQIFTLWRENLKLFVHPKFHCPQQPQLLKEVVLEYTQRTRKVAIDLVEALCHALELDPRYVDEVLKLNSSFQIFATNYYPTCPHPDQAIGLPPHTDPGLLTLLIHNGVAGLQIEHDGKWFAADSPQDSILVNVANQLEIFTNGRYKSVKHRAIVNEQRERISIVVSNGPSGEAVVVPAAALVEKDGHAMTCSSMKYEDLLGWQLLNPTSRNA